MAFCLFVYKTKCIINVFFPKLKKFKITKIPISILYIKYNIFILHINKRINKIKYYLFLLILWIFFKKKKIPVIYHVYIIYYLKKNRKVLPLMYIKAARFPNLKNSPPENKLYHFLSMLKKKLGVLGYNPVSWTILKIRLLFRFFDILSFYPETTCE